MAKDFSAAIQEIMPLVKDGDKSTPFIIARNKDGSWDVHYPYPVENTGSLLQKLKERDPFTVMFTGAEFANGSFPYVYDKVLSGRLRAELDNCDYAGDTEAKEARAVLNFFEDRIGEFSHQTTDYLATVDKPLAELVVMCPHKMAIDNDEWSYNEKLASDAIHHIENEVNARLSIEAKSEPRVIDGYAFTETQSVQIGKISVILAECLEAPSPFLVCNRVDDKDYNHSVFPGYPSAMREFTARQTALGKELEAHGQPSRGNEPSLLGELNDAKAEVAARNATPKDRSHTKKRGDMEV